MNKESNQADKDKEIQSKVMQYYVDENIFNLSDLNK